MSSPAPLVHAPEPPTETQLPNALSQTSRLSGVVAVLIRIRPSFAPLQVPNVASVGKSMDAAPSCNAAELLVRSIPAVKAAPPVTSRFLLISAVVGSPLLTVQRPPEAAVAVA